MSRARNMVLFVLSTLVTSGSAMGVPSAQQVVDAVGARHGICVVVGETAAGLARDLARDSELTIYMQVTRPKELVLVNHDIDEKGCYGNRIFVGLGTDKLHLADNVADVAVVLPQPAPAIGELPHLPRPAEAEVLRVVRPGGKVIFPDRTITKPFPQGIDDWTHPYHGPDNNPQSEDKVIVAPYLTQFLAEPRYAPLPQVAVTSAGRVFKAFGHVAFKEREEPFLNKLVAFNGYNGTILWQRDLAEGVMIHRNTMVATPAALYLGDNRSCKVIDAATGKLLDEIVPPEDVAGGTFWKWMAIEGDVLYAMMGEQEQGDSTKRWKLDKHGWPWDPISEGWNQPGNPWGFGRSVLAIDMKTKKVLWSHQEQEPIDGRAICMSHGRIYAFRFGGYLACLDAADGRVLWRKTAQDAPELFEAIGEYQDRQDWRTNWRTTCYLKCSDKALYFAGPPIGKLLAVSAQDGSILWEHPYSNFQLVLREDGLYGISGQIDKHPSMKFDPLTGKVLAEIAKPRRACTRPTGSSDAIFFRAEGGSVRLDLASNRPRWISPMRPVCQEGVTVANGLLYWWPSVCDCQLTLYGVTCLGPAGDFDFTPEPDAAGRLERGDSMPGEPARLAVHPMDWPAFRANNACTASTPAWAIERPGQLWDFDLGVATPAGLPRITAPVTAGGLVFVGGADGIVRAIETSTGIVAWKAYTGGAIRMPPTIWKGRAYVGSGDGWVYCLEANSGRLLWRFRAAPAERLIPVYGMLMSTWPVASGVLVEDGVAYAAAGIANYDGTYVYALDARTGAVKWQNSTSGHLDPEARTGVSVQGHLLLHGGKLYLPGGTSLSPAVYDAATGKCLNETGQLAECVSRSPRGWELSLLGDQVVACGKPFYGHPMYDVYDITVFNRAFMGSAGSTSVVWVSDASRHRVMGFTDFDREGFGRNVTNPGNRFNVNWGRLAPEARPAWSLEFGKAHAMAVCGNAVLLATDNELVAMNPSNGIMQWKQPLPRPPMPWGLAVDRNGRAVVSLVDGRVLCFGAPRETVTIR